MASAKMVQAMASSPTTRARLGKDPLQTNKQTRTVSRKNLAGLASSFNDNGREKFYRQEPDWNSLIIHAFKCGNPRNALKLYHQKIQEHGLFCPSSYTIVALLKACSKIKDLETGEHIHASLPKYGMVETNVYVCSALVYMYAKCGSLAQAQAIFDKLTDRDVVVWSVLISGYAEHGYGENALHSLVCMQNEGISPDPFTFVGILKACGNMKESLKGQEFNDEIVKKGFEAELFVGSALVDMYAKCGLLTEAQEVVYKLPVRDVVLWTALIAGYAEHGHNQGAIDLFNKMQLDGCSQVVVTYVCAFKACGNMRSTQKGQIIHIGATLKGFERDPVVGSTLVDMYVKCGSLADAQLVFNKLSTRNAIPWTALISGYAEQGYGEAALECFKCMQQEGISSDAVTLLCSLKACASVGATNQGRDLHVEIVKKGWEKQHFAGSMLVDMYAKCGSLQDAEQVFNHLPNQDVVSWTALVAGYAQLGQNESVFKTVDRMIESGIKPDNITLSSVLNMCSQAGLVGKSHMYFEAFVRLYGLTPTPEHYSCMIGIFCRAGYINKAIEMIKRIPFQPGIVVWSTILAACRKWRDVELGRYAFEQALKLNDKEVTVYIYMSNIYADASMVEEAKQIEALRLEMHAF